jgi:hypothetical protein
MSYFCQRKNTIRNHYYQYNFEGEYYLDKF